jgi:hypothetical protein
LPLPRKPVMTVTGIRVSRSGGMTINLRNNRKWLLFCPAVGEAQV